MVLFRTIFTTTITQSCIFYEIGSFSTISKKIKNEKFSAEAYLYTKMEEIKICGKKIKYTLNTFSVKFFSHLIESASRHGLINNTQFYHHSLNKNAKRKKIFGQFIFENLSNCNAQLSFLGPACLFFKLILSPYKSHDPKSQYWNIFIDFM